MATYVTIFIVNLYAIDQHIEHNFISINGETFLN